MTDLSAFARSVLDNQERLGLKRSLNTVPHRVLNLGSNNYLGLSRHPDVIKAAARSLKRCGTGATGSRLTSGTSPEHVKLEAELAEWKGAEAALLFSSG